MDDVLREFEERIRPKPEAISSETEAAELSLYQYSKQCWSIIRPGDKWVDGWVFGCLCEHAQALAEGQIKKLGVACPPRHGKSLVFNVFMPTWAWIRQATKRYMYTAYSDQLVRDHSIACRDLILSKWYQDRWGHRFRFKSDQNTQSLFSNDRGGYRLATTVGGVATGKGCDVMVADDIISVRQSFSAAALEEAWRYWTQTMTMRFENPEAIMRAVLMQRLRKNDLLGRLIKEQFGYEVLTLPFEGEPHRITYSFPEPAQNSESGASLPVKVLKLPKHPILPTTVQLRDPQWHDTRDAGEILWPERFTSPETIADLKKSVQAGAAGQLQQRPEDDAGAIFKPSKFKLFYPTWTEKGLAFLLGDEVPRTVYASECLWYQTGDTAMKIEQANDETAFVTCCKSPMGDLLFFDVAAFRLLIPEQWAAMKQFRSGRPEWNPDRRDWRIPGKLRPWPRMLAFQAVEDKNSGTALIQQARSEGYALKVLHADNNKTMRAAPLATLYEQGSVYHNAEGAWRTDFEDQMSNFPTGAHDDMVDAAAYAGILFVHDVILNSFNGGDVVLNPSVREELDIVQAMEDQAQKTGWIPPPIRPQQPEERESLDDILAALRGQPRKSPPAVDSDGKLRDEFLHDED